MVGSTISHYKIVSELGRGGMGIVYEAEDTRLNRTVAIKVLPSAALSNEDDRARFYREARAAASLAHPHIAVVHEIDEAVPDGSKKYDLRPFIAMEFIDGETLDAKIKKGPLKLDDAVRIASEIASGLEAAHEKNVVHRDIKSANVMLTQKGEAKILDFGLAQTAASTKLTKMGSTVGTVGYMSPEQARAEEVDHRTDIWSLGVVLYEMVSGRHPFPGDYEQAVVYEILNQDAVPLTSLRTGVPLELERIVFKCLMKDQKRRYQHADELIADLSGVDLTSTAAGIAHISGPNSEVERGQGPLESYSGQTKPSLTEIAKAAWPLIASVSIFTLVVSYLIFSGGIQQSSTVRVQKLPIHLEGITSVAYPAVSPTSEYLAFSGTDTLGQSGLFLFHSETAEITHLAGTEGGSWPRFAPNGEQLAFGKELAIYLVTVPAGAPSLIATSGMRPVWESSRSILYHDPDLRGVMRIELDSGSITAVALPDSSSENLYEYHILSVIPEIRLGIGIRQRAGYLDPSLLFIDLESGIMSLSEEGITSPSYIPNGFLAYQVGTSFGPIVVRPFDPASGEFTGPPEGLLPDISWTGQFVGNDGSLLYAPELIGPVSGHHRLFLIDLTDKSVEAIETNRPEDGFVVRPSFSPSGKSIAVHFENDVSMLRFVSELDLEKKMYTRRTFGESRRDPDWSSDGAFLYFDGYTSQSLGIYKQSIDVPGEEILVVEGHAYNPNLSPDGNWLTYGDDNDIWLYELATGTTSIIDASSGEQHYPEFSPDSKYIAYQTIASGTWQIAVRPISGAAYIPIAHPQATNPKWGPDGESLYYLDQSGGIYKVPVTTEPFFQVNGDAIKIASVTSQLSNQWFDISPDGNTLVVTGTSVDVDTNIAQKRYSTLMWWQNWAQSLSNQ